MRLCLSSPKKEGNLVNLKYDTFSSQALTNMNHKRKILSMARLSSRNSCNQQTFEGLEQFATEQVGNNFG